MKNTAFYTFIAACVLSWVALGYYVVVNTVLVDEVLPNVDVDTQVSSIIPEILYVSIGEEQYSFSTSKINPQIDLTKAKDYGKGADILGVLSGGMTLMGGGVELKADVNIDVGAFLEQLGIRISSGGLVHAQFISNIAANCESNTYNINPNETLLAEKIKGVLSSDSDHIYLSWEEILPAEHERKLVKACNKYIKEGPLIESALQQIAPGRSVSGLFGVNSDGVWQVIDTGALRDLLGEYAKSVLVPAENGVYEIIEGKIALLEPYRYGSTVDVGATIRGVNSWLENPTRDFPIVRSDIVPSVLQQGRDVVNFTKKLASGKSRIDYARVYTVTYAQHGVEEVHNAVIMPGQEFSYEEHLNPGGIKVRGRTASGRPIGGGICNATTTLYRAALEAGFRITDRKSHGFYVQSYSWGEYKDSNIIEATYWAGVVDLKFINDLKYPVLLRTNVKRDDKGWQYHTIDVMTDPRAPDRDVEFENWRRWREQSPTRYSGSVDRIVREAGQIIRRDRIVTEFY